MHIAHSSQESSDDEPGKRYMSTLINNRSKNVQKHTPQPIEECRKADARGPSDDGRTKRVGGNWGRYYRPGPGERTGWILEYRFLGICICLLLCAL